MNKFDQLANAALAEEGIGRHLKAIGRSITSPLAIAHGAGNVLKGIGNVAGAFGAKTWQGVLSKPADIATSAKEKHKNLQKWIKNPDISRDSNKWWEGDTNTMEKKLPSRGDIFQLVLNNKTLKGQIVRKKKIGTDIVYGIITNAKDIKSIELIVNDTGRFTTNLRTKSGNIKTNINAKLMPTGRKGYWVLKV